MITATDALTLHQLLGRIVYFHVLFIEPELPTTDGPAPGTRCCHHEDNTRLNTDDDLLGSTAWAVLAEVAATVDRHWWACPQRDGDCCAGCQVITAAGRIAAAWAHTEHVAYYGRAADGELVRGCRRVAGQRLGRGFAGQHAVSCRQLARIPVNEDDQVVAGDGWLPLVGELLALWADPTTTTGAPVVSWLNHCTVLDDIRRRLPGREITA